MYFLILAFGCPIGREMQKKRNAIKLLVALYINSTQHKCKTDENCGCEQAILTMVW